MVIKKVNLMTKAKVVQIGFLISLIGLIVFKLIPISDANYLTSTSISSFILISLVLVWVFSYISRVISGNMTFMEQRKRYREKYEKVMEEKLKIKFDNLSDEEQDKLLKEIEK